MRIRSLLDNAGLLLKVSLVLVTQLALVLAVRAQASSGSYIAAFQQELPDGPVKTALTASSDLIRIPAGTPVRLGLLTPINSSHLQQGQQLKFRVLSDVTVEGVTAIAKRSDAVGHVVAVQPPQRRLRSGYVTIQLDSVTGVDGRVVSLTGSWDLKGHLTAETQAGIFDFTLRTMGLGAPALLLVKGDPVIVDRAVEFDVTTSDDVTIARGNPAESHAENSSSTGPARVVVYNYTRQLGAARVWCGAVRAADLPPHSRAEFLLPPGEYWFRSGKRNGAVLLKVRQGDIAYLRAKPIKCDIANPRACGAESLETVEDTVAEIELEDTLAPAKNVADLSKAGTQSLLVDNRHKQAR